MTDAAVTPDALSPEQLAELEPYLRKVEATPGQTLDQALNSAALDIAYIASLGAFCDPPSPEAVRAELVRRSAQ